MKKQPTSKDTVWKTLRNPGELLLFTFKNSTNVWLLGSKNQRHEVWFETCAQYCMLSEIWHCPLYLFPVFLLTTETLLCTNHLCPLPSLHPTLIPFFTTLSLFAAETLLWAKFRTSVIQYSSLHFPHLSPTIVHFNASSYSTVFPMSRIHLLCVLLTGSCSLWEYIERKYEGIKTAPKHSVYQRQTYLWVWKVGQLPKKCHISNSQQGATLIKKRRPFSQQSIEKQHYFCWFMTSVNTFLMSSWARG